MVPPDPQLQERLYKEFKRLKKQDKALTELEFLVSKGLFRQRVFGMDDNLRVDPRRPVSHEESLIQLPSFKPTGDVNVLFLLVDFSDRPHTVQADSLRNLFFSEGSESYDHKSLKDYYSEVSYGKVNIIGYVSDWYRMPQPYSYYATDDGLGPYPRNAQRMVEDAISVAKEQGGVDWDKFDVDGDGMIEALSVVHAGRGAEQTGPGTEEIWSHKYQITSKVNLTTNTYALTYLTVPEDSKIGVIAHELGHLLFGWPDLYDAQPRGTRVTEGLGDWCLMASGSWNNMGRTPGFPSAWCRHVQGWTETVNVQKKQRITVANAEASSEVFRLWTKGQQSSEYFLVENRQKTGFDKYLPGHGLLIFQIDEKMPNNWKEDHLAVGLMQADGTRDLQNPSGIFRNRGDAGDPYPGTTKNYRFASNTKPNSKAYSGRKTGVTLKLITEKSAKHMQATVTV